MAIKEIKKFALSLNYSQGKFGIGLEFSETDKQGFMLDSSLEVIALAGLLQHSQNATYDDETRTIETNYRPLGEAIKEWPDLNRPEPSVSTISSGGLGAVLKKIERGKQGEA
jgi:hypothetical protein